MHLCVYYIYIMYIVIYYIYIMASTEQSFIDNSPQMPLFLTRFVTTHL